MTQELPTIKEYIDHTNELLANNLMTLEQVMILQTCYKNTMADKSTNINFLMQITGLDWKAINWTLNGLVLRGALSKVDLKNYRTKIN